MAHLFLAVTAHGYGHLAQAAPVVEALVERVPGLRVTLQGDIDEGFARRRLPGGFVRIDQAADPGLAGDGPLVTRWEESLAAYVRFELDYPARLERQLAILRDLAPDLVLADVPWLPLDAAGRLGIPAVALCSLSWYDILRESPVAPQVPAPVLERMRRVYGGADLFIRPAPTMPMAWLPNGVDVGPIARRHPDRAQELRERLGIPPRRPLALMQFGGLSGFDPLADWPEQEQVHWLVPDLRGADRRDASCLRRHGIDLTDVLGSVDLLLGKPGYGTFAEAACNGIPVLYTSRSDWPEEPALTAWLARQVPTREIALADLIAGRVAGPMAELLACPRPVPVEPTGIGEAAELLMPYLVPAQTRPEKDRARGLKSARD